MSFNEGMKLFRAGDIPAACEQFQQAVEQDENNHKAWNALGICLSKSGEHDDAATCFENALMLDPGNSTYEKNQEKNEAKRPVNWQVRPKQEVKADTKPAPVEKPLSFYLLTAAKFLGRFLIFCFICVFIAAFVFGMSGGAAAKSKEQVSIPSKAVSLAGNAVTFQPTQQVTSAPITKPVVKQPVNTATLGERNAAKKALSYLRFTNFSYSGLVKQLEYEGFSHAEAVYGVDQSGADWNEQAAGKAKSYLEFSSFSRERLIEQLEYEGFTRSQAEYGAKAVGY